MKPLYLRISIVLFIVIYAFVIYYLNFATFTTNIKVLNYTPPMGNIMASFFYATNTSLVDVAQINFYIDQINKMPDSELKNFYQKLPWQSKFSMDLINDYISKDEDAWSSLDSNGANKKHYLEFWQKVRPIMQDFYAQHLPSVTSVNPVVHFRCSDSPMNRNIQYHLTKAATIAWMVGEIKKRGFSTVTFLNCNTHNKIDDNSCARYADYYIKLFSQHGVRANVECGSVMHDFSLMYNSPLLISLNASSFSFMAGMAKNPHDYVSCNMGKEIKGKYYTQNTADWLLDNNEPLLHQTVFDYSKIEDVINQL